MHLEHCSIGTSVDGATKSVMAGLARWCPAMRLILVSLHSNRRLDLDPMQELDVEAAIDHHSMLETHTLDEHLDECKVSDLFHLSGRGVPVRTCLYHAVATVIAGSATVAASVDNEK